MASGKPAARKGKVLCVECGKRYSPCLVCEQCYGGVGDGGPAGFRAAKGHPNRTWNGRWMPRVTR